LLELGDRAAGRLTGDAVRIRNIGPDCVTLRVRGEHQWIRPGAEQIEVNPGEIVAVPFCLDLPPGVFGQVMTAIQIEGRSVRYSVAVRATARKVDVRAVPDVVVLGDMIPGEERAFTVDVVNAGEIVAEISETHMRGDLEVWIHRATVQPGERVTLAGRVRVSIRQTRQEVRATVPLADEATVRFVANVIPSIVPTLVAAGAATGGLIAGFALSTMIEWWVGIPFAFIGLAMGAWLYWLDMT
jgi:hypothetical protein